MAAALTPGEQDEARFALSRRILHLREVIREHVRRAATGRGDQISNIAAAHKNALWLAEAEHAYRKLGGLDDRYLPACYRTPPMPKEAAA